MHQTIKQYFSNIYKVVKQVFIVLNIIVVYRQEYIFSQVPDKILSNRKVLKYLKYFDYESIIILGHIYYTVFNKLMSIKPYYFDTIVIAAVCKPAAVACKIIFPF